MIDGRAVVTFDVDREFLPIYENATILMRPLTGLRDMFFSLDPGTRDAEGGEIEEDDTIPLANTAPDVPLDQVLEALDNDNQAYLRAILVGAGQGLDGRGKDLGRVLGSLGPINRDLERLNTKVAERDENLSSLVHNLSVLDEVRRHPGSGRDAPRHRVERRARGDRHRGPGHPDRYRVSCRARWRTRATRLPRQRASATSWVRRSTRCGRSPATCRSSTRRRPSSPRR